MAMEKTYIMIKPDGVANGHIGEIINRFERAGLKIERMELGNVTPEQAAANYQEHEGKPFYDGLITYITSGPVVKMIISGDGAVLKCRSLMGATNPAEAAPGTIRGDFGLIMDENVIHGSDSVASADGDLLRVSLGRAQPCATLLVRLLTKGSVHALSCYRCRQAFFTRSWFHE